MTIEKIIKHLEYLKIAAEIDAKPESINAEIIGAAIQAIKERLTYLKAPSIQPVKMKESAGRIITETEAAYCEDCDHADMCSWYGTIGCEWKTKGMYERGYNDAKREISLSGEYERCYERGKADAEKKYEEMKAQKEPCEDAISREELRKMTVAECAGHTIEYAMGWKACIDYLNTRPSVQPVRAIDNQIIEKIKSRMLSDDAKIVDKGAYNLGLQVAISIIEKEIFDGNNI